MEFGFNGSIANFFKNNKLYFKNKQNVLRIFRGMLQGIQYLHQNKYIHADLKDANIVVDENKNPIIIDFDLSIPINSIEVPRGTPLFMGPELFQGHAIKYTPAVDIFALGIILYHLTHDDEHPWHLYSLQTIRQTILNEGLHLEAGLDTEIAYLIAGCLRSQPEDRFSLQKLLDLTDIALNFQNSNTLQYSYTIKNNQDMINMDFTLVEEQYLNHQNNMNFYRHDIFLNDGNLVGIPQIEAIPINKENDDLGEDFELISNNSEKESYKDNYQPKSALIMRLIIALFIGISVGTIYFVYRYVSISTTPEMVNENNDLENPMTEVVHDQYG